MSSTFEVDSITAITTDSNITIKGKGSGKVSIGDGNLLFPDSDGSSDQVIKTDGSGVLGFADAGGGGGGATQEFFSPVTFASGGATMNIAANFGPGAQANSDNDTGHVAFIVPADFLSIDELVFVVNPDVTNGASWWKISVRYGSPGQAPNAHSSDNSVYYDVTEDVLYEVDLSGLFSAIVAGDQCGVMIYMNGSGGDVTFLGVRFKY